MKHQPFKEFLLSVQLEPTLYSTFLAYLAHDLRKPLGGILSSLDLLQDISQAGEENSLEQQERILVIMRRMALELFQMTTDMADASHELRDQRKIDD